MEANVRRAFAARRAGPLLPRVLGHPAAVEALPAVAVVARAVVGQEENEDKDDKD